MNTRRICRCFLVLSFVFPLIAVMPQGSLAQTKNGIELYNSWQYKEAERVLRAALRADPSDALANYYLGLSVLAQENYKEALEIFMKAKQNQNRTGPRIRPAVPNEYQIQLGLARARIGLHQYDEAWKNLESARKENGSSSEVFTYRGVYYLEQDKYKEAIKELEKAMSLDKDNPYAFYYVGLAYYASGNAQKAVDALKTFLSLAPDAPEAAKAKELIDKLC